MKFTESLSEQGKKNWAELRAKYPDKEGERRTTEDEMESQEEMVKIMEEVPPYSVDKQGREG